MNKKTKPRAPAAFRLEGSGNIQFGQEPEATTPVLAPLPRLSRGWPWGKMLFAALGALLSFAFSLWAYETVLALFARKDWLGWTAVGLAGLAAAAFVGWWGRELTGLFRLKRIGKVRDLAAHASQNKTAALRLSNQLGRLYAGRPELFDAVTELARHRTEVIDAADRIALTERVLMAPLDARARRLVADTVKRVSLVTAVSPAALIDLGFVAYSHMGLIRRLAELYGGRPGIFATLRLSRLVVTHLVITGGMALGDGLVQQLLGHSLAAKLSARLGEGVFNGILAARVGMAAIEVCRPLPFAALPRPTLAELATTLTIGTGVTGNPPQTSSPPAAKS